MMLLSESSFNVLDSPGFLRKASLALPLDLFDAEFQAVLQADLITFLVWQGWQTNLRFLSTMWNRSFGWITAAIGYKTPQTKLPVRSMPLIVNKVAKMRTS
jgi:hypothetical protein